MLLVEEEEDDFGDHTILELADPELLKEYLASVRKMHWDEAHFQRKLWEKLKTQEPCERGSSASFLASSKRRERDLKLLEKRLLLILEEKPK